MEEEIVGKEYGEEGKEDKGKLKKIKKCCGGSMKREERIIKHGSAMTVLWCSWNHLERSSDLQVTCVNNSRIVMNCYENCYEWVFRIYRF